MEVGGKYICRSMSKLHRIEVAIKPGLLDSLARRLALQLTEDAGLPAQAVRTLRVFTLEGDITETELALAGKKLFADPISEIWALDQALTEKVLPNFDLVFEIGFKPGVTDNVGHSSAEGLSELLGRPFTGKVFASLQVLVKGVTPVQAAAAAASLHNALIEECELRTAAQWKAGERFAARSRAVLSSHTPVVETIALPKSDEDLLALSKKRTLALTVEEMRCVKEHYDNPEVQAKRAAIGMPVAPTDVELEVIAQTWSEHCKHKLFAATIEYVDGEHKETIKSLYKSFVRRATEELRPKRPDLVSVFVDNAGVIRFDDENHISIKAETHNSPSALDPYGGAMTGIVGVNRDILGTGKGCRPIFNTDVFCFAPPDWAKPLPPRLMHPRRILRGVHRGVKDGGNESGIPTVNGSIVFHERFLGKPLVFCGTGGIMPANLPKPDGTLEDSADKSVSPGDRVVMVGGRIGKDGIHGATFSSEALTEASPVSAVQIGDPITQKKMTDFLLEARDLGLYRWITDNGAGGLSSSIGEMAKECGGAVVDLEKAPLKYPGLDPWEIFVSEAQERMSVAVPADKIDEFLALSKRRAVESTDLGSFDDNGLLILKHEGKVVAALDMEFLHEGLPEMVVPARWEAPVHAEPDLSTLKETPAETLLGLLSAWNICSKESWVRMYDHEVQGGSVVKPFTGAKNDGPSDAAVIRPVATNRKGLAVSHGIAPRYSDIDAGAMTEAALDEALRNLVCVGGDPDQVVALDNFCWPDPVEAPGNPDGAYKMAQLVRSNKALYETCVACNMPLVSGKDSMKNDYGAGKERISVPPTLLVTALAPMPDAHKAVTLDAKAAGDKVYVLGLTREETGASEWFTRLGFIGNKVPRLKTAETLPLYRGVFSAIQDGLVRSAHDASDGGLGVALAETAMAGRLGISVDLAKVPAAEELTDSVLLWSESLGRLVVTVAPENVAAFEKRLEGSAFACVGEITEFPEVEFHSEGTAVVRVSVDACVEAWKKPFRS